VAEVVVNRGDDAAADFLAPAFRFQALGVSLVGDVGQLDQDRRNEVRFEHLERRRAVRFCAELRLASHVADDRAGKQVGAYAGGAGIHAGQIREHVFDDVAVALADAGEAFFRDVDAAGRLESFLLQAFCNRWA
jgi:hypothetical protein